MWIEHVQLRPFGPFRERSIQFAPGFTVIAGANEAGKSTIHAATNVALCGIRRAAGKRSDDAVFAELHRPWDATAWAVTTVVTLRDGSRVELRRNLESSVDQVTDLGLGHDASGIIFEGSPDGSRWLGLNRRTFLATACIRQTDMMRVCSDAGLLQESLQRVADTAGADETAAAALDVLRKCRRDDVGLDRVNGRKPLRVAIDRYEEAGRNLDRAGVDRKRYEELADQTDGLARQAAHAQSMVRALEVTISTAAAGEWQEKLRRAQTLTEQLAGGSAEPVWTNDEGLADRVAGTIAAWSGLGSSPALTGPTGEHLRTLLVDLPDEVSGDLEPDSTILLARDAYAAAARALIGAQAESPRLPKSVESPVDALELRRLADELDLTVPSIDPELAQRHAEAERRVRHFAGRRPLLALGAAFVVGMVTSGIAAVAGMVPVAAGLALLGLIAAVVGFAHVQRIRAGAMGDLRLSEHELGARLYAVEGIRQRRDVAHARATELRLPTNPVELRVLSEEFVEAAAAERVREAWRARVTSLERERQDALSALVGSISRRGIPLDGDPEPAVAAYVQACADRAQMARKAAQRCQIEQQLEAREHLEHAATEWTRRRDVTEQQLKELATQCRVVGAEGTTIVTALRDWQNRRVALLEGRTERVHRQANLAALLGTGSLAELEASVMQRVARAHESAASIDSAVLGVPLCEDPESELGQWREDARGKASRAAAAHGQLESLGTSLSPVADTEEALAEAGRELGRVQRLDKTLVATIDFLERAQARIYRDIAPLLAQAVAGRLSRATGGRYDEVIVTPKTLEVRVRHSGGAWRDAAKLSQGTREVIFLLLRIALVEQLTRKGEISPLLLDDVTVQCDGPRTHAIMHLLHDISRDRQVIFFTQEDDARSWAEGNLREPQDRLEVLDATGIPA